jgi:hypothetical protein
MKKNFFMTAMVCKSLFEKNLSEAKMKKIKLSNESEQEKTNRAFLMIMDLMNNNKDIEPSLWSGAACSILANGYKQCNFTYK